MRKRQRVWLWKNRAGCRNSFCRKAVGHVLLIWHPATNLTAFGEEEEMKGAVTDCLCKAASNQHHALLMTLMASVLITRLWTASGHVTGDHTWSAQARRLTVHKHFLYTSSSPPLTLHPTSLPSLSPPKAREFEMVYKGIVFKRKGVNFGGISIFSTRRPSQGGNVLESRNEIKWNEILEK